MSTTAPDAIASYPERYFAAWNGRDIGAVEQIVTPAFSWIDPLLPAEVTDYDGIRPFFQGAWQGFPDLAFAQIGEILLAGDGRVAAEWRMTGTHTGEGFPPGVPATGKPFEVLGTDVWTVGEDGRATQVRAYYSALTLMQQLGLA